MSDLDRFELFTYVAESLSMTQAARQLGMTKAALSKQIKQLEQSLRINLFIRYKQRLRLTTEGEMLLKQCLGLRHGLDNVRSLCAGFHAKPLGNLHVVIFPYFAETLIFPQLKDFLEQYPDIHLRIDTTERVPDFTQEQTDLAVGFSLPVPNPDKVIQKRMATTRYILSASPQYFKEQGKPVYLKDLEQHRYLEHASRLPFKTLKLKPGYHLALKPYLLLNSVNAMIACAKQGLGLIQLPLYMVEHALEQGELVEVLTDYQAVNASVYYHYPKVQYMQPKVRKFIEYFLEPICEF